MMSNSYNDLIEKQNENQKILIHDIKNHMITLNDMCEEVSDEGVKDYIGEILELPAFTDVVDYSENKVLNIIINRFETYCKKRDISFDLDVSRADTSLINSVDLTSLLSNALENAVEAAAKTASPYVIFKLSNANNNSLLITIENSCEKMPQKTSMGTFVSTKPSSYDHGLGTLSILRTAKKYNGHVDYSFDESTKAFHTVILLYKGETSEW